MVMWDLMTWWYTEGWRQCGERVKGRLLAAHDFFSIDLLVKTLFSPFRQISAGAVRGPFAVQVRAFFDQLISRCIGTVVRLIMIFVGAVVIVFNLISGGLLLLLWAVVPFLPLIGLVVYMTGWLPWNG